MKPLPLLQNRTMTCETMTNDASANTHKNSMSSQQERIELVALPPQHIGPCATQLTTASARTLEPLPRSSQSKNMTGSGNQCKDIPKKVPTPGQSNNKTSDVFNNTDTTSAPKGFNHLSQPKGERVGRPGIIPVMPAAPFFSLLC